MVVCIHIIAVHAVCVVAEYCACEYFRDSFSDSHKCRAILNYYNGRKQ